MIHCTTCSRWRPLSTACPCTLGAGPRRASSILEPRTGVDSRPTEAQLNWAATAIEDVRKMAAKNRRRAETPSVRGHCLAADLVLRAGIRAMEAEVARLRSAPAADVPTTRPVQEGPGGPSWTQRAAQRYADLCVEWHQMGAATKAEREEQLRQLDEAWRVLGWRGDDTGFDAAPARYSLPDGKEAIDVIREYLGDAGFLAFCRGCWMKYRLRDGRKGDAEGDADKARFYLQMAAYVQGVGPDPRRYRR